MEPSPASAFVMAEAEFLFQLLVVLFDDPALFGERDQMFQFCAGRQGRKPVLYGFGLRPGLFDYQPFLRMWLSLPVITMRWSDAHGSKPRTQFVLCPLTPVHRFPCFGRERESQLLH